jgi:ABC-type dipeptide/oligopeptide/nickel transport system ATPase component
MLISCEDSREVTILVVDEVRKNVFIGRDNEINQILEDLKSNKGARLLIVGESGSGKSALLDELYRRLTREVDQNNRPFVGYYSKKEALIAESESLIYPFSIVLEKLVNNAKESEQLYEKIDSTISRMKKGLLKFGKEHGIKIGVAIIEDLAIKVGLKETLDVGKDILKAVGSEKTSLMLAQQYVVDHSAARDCAVETLGVPQPSLDSFPEEFRQGMAARASILNDIGDNAPANWEYPFGTSAELCP